MQRLNEAFSSAASAVGHAAGHSLAFIAACLFVLAWMLTGPVFRFSDTWQLVINTSTTIITFLMIFLIQNTQNRNDKAMQLKLDEIILKLDATSNAMAGVEDQTDAQLDAIRERLLGR